MKLDDLIKSSSKSPIVAIPKAADTDILLCVSQAMAKGIAKFILIDEKAKILNAAKECGADIEGAEFVENSGDEVEACNLAAKLVFDGKAHVLMKGLVQTSTFMKSLLNKDFGFVPEGALLSHIGLFEIKNNLVIVTDAAININPDAESKARIIENAIKTAKAIGIIKPKVALVAAVEKINPKIQSTVDAEALKQMAINGRFENALIDGPFGLDVAVSKEAAEIKNIKSEVAGNPDILMLPSLDAGNVLYKSLTYLLEITPASVVAGASIPVVLTSRADDEKTKLYSIALASKLAL